MTNLLNRLGKFLASLSGINVDELLEEVEYNKNSTETPSVFVG